MIATEQHTELLKGIKKLGNLPEVLVHLEWCAERGVHDTKTAMQILEARENFSVDGFIAFFKVVYGLDILWYMEEAIEELFKTHAIAVEAFVESAKTTTLSEAFYAYFIGHHPDTSSMLIQVGDTKAATTASAVATLISTVEEWAWVFPHVTPDKDKSWSTNGYELKVTKVKEDGVWREVTYAEWRKINVARKDPTFVGLGYKSSAIIGARITGLLIVDDIHDDTNTFSERELQATLRKLRGPIMSRATKKAWQIFVGTPWVEDDTIDFVKNTGRYVHLFIPVYEEAEKGDEGAIYWSRHGLWLIPAWPDLYDIDYLEQKWIELGEADFARFLLLDLTKVGNRVFYWQEYDHEKISPTWPTGGGVDFASILVESQKNDPNRSFFAMAYVAKLPQGGAVVVGGVRDRCIPAQGEAYMMRAQTTYQQWLTTIVEGDGKGEVFLSILMRNPQLRFIGMKTGGKGKERRLEGEMSPWFENGTVKISTADTPFLNALRKEMRDYPHGKHKDCMDAVYWALRGMPDVLVMQKENAKKSGLPTTGIVTRNPNPFGSFARM